VLNKRSRIARAALAMSVIVLAAGCAATTASPALASPFAIVARWSGAHLHLLYPRALAVGPDGNVYVTDNHMRVTVISPDGVVLRWWGSLGTGRGEFRAPSTNSDPTDMHLRIAIGDGLVYVSDSGNNRVQVFTLYGSFVRQFGTGILSPDFLAVDGAGNTYVNVGSGIAKFSPTGAFIWNLGTGTTSDPDLVNGVNPGNFDSHGMLVVANPLRNRILYLSPEGHKVDFFDVGTSLLGGPCLAAVDAQGYAFVTACGPQGDTLVFDQTHTLVARWSGAHDALVTAPSFGPNGEVFALGFDGSLLKLKITLAQG
jgi:NHL repeat